jgi:hypothetical protein
MYIAIQTNHQFTKNVQNGSEVLIQPPHVWALQVFYLCVVLVYTHKTLNLHLIIFKIPPKDY